MRIGSDDATRHVPINAIIRQTNTVRPSADDASVQSGRISSRRGRIAIPPFAYRGSGKFVGPACASADRAAVAIAMPATPPAADTIAASVISLAQTRRVDAPSVVRTANSRCRVSARASTRDATLLNATMTSTATMAVTSHRTCSKPPTASSRNL